MTDKNTIIENDDDIFYLKWIFVFLIMVALFYHFGINSGYLTYELIDETINESINETKKQLVVSCMFNGTGWGANIESYNDSIIDYYANRCALERGYFRMEEWAIS